MKERKPCTGLSVTIRTPIRALVLELKIMYEFDDNLDCSALSFQEWVRLFFDWPEPTQMGDGFGIAVEEECTFFDAKDPSKIVDHLTRLFGDFSRTLSDFTLPQINRGIWAMFGPNFECQRYLFDRSIPLESRLACIRSMYSVYADFVAPSEVEAMENCFFMWWDLISESFWTLVDQDIDPEKSLDMDPKIDADRKDLNKLDREAWQILETIFETLSRILALDDGRTKQFALHGLGHLNHPGVKTLVQEFIDVHDEEFTEEGLKWVEECRDGCVM